MHGANSLDIVMETQHVDDIEDTERSTSYLARDTMTTTVIWSPRKMKFSTTTKITRTKYDFIVDVAAEDDDEDFGGGRRGGHQAKRWSGSEFLGLKAMADSDEED